LTPFYTDWLLRYSTTLNGRGGANDAPSPSTDQLPSRNPRSKDDKEPKEIQMSGEHQKLFMFNSSTIFLHIFFGGLECVGHSFAYVAHFVFLRDV
jgi:hypothetical protein